MQFRLTEAEREKVRQGYRQRYAQGLHPTPNPQEWEIVAIEVWLVLSDLWRSLRRFFGYHWDLY